jgi:hypothetical protein
MPDLSLGADRSYSLVTTVVHRSPRQCKIAQLDLHLTAGDVRLRFLDRETLHRFCSALADLAAEAYLPSPHDYRPVRSRVYTNHDAPAEPVPLSFLDTLYS